LFLALKKKVKDFVVSDLIDKQEDGIDVIDAASSGGSFLGVGRVSESTVTVFAPKHGIMAIKPGTVGGL